MTPAKPDRQREANLKCALGFLRLPSTEPELRLLHRWLDTWTGLGLITVGVECQGYRLSLTHITEGEWRATFQANPMWAPAGFGVGPTPWKAVQAAAWVAMNRADNQQSRQP
jgi:hypothetical protein